MKFEILFKLKNVIYSKKKIINQVMMNFVYFEGVRAKVQKLNFKFISIAVVAISIVFLTACPGPKGPNSSGEKAATVNGKAISMEEVERAIKAQFQGQEAKMAPLELANARLSALQNLIQTEVMYQKAEKEQTVPKDEDVVADFNKLKTESGRSVEEFDKSLKEAGETEETAKEAIKRKTAVEKLIEKITSKVEPPKDSEIQAFYDGNKEAFIKKKGVKLAMIVIDPTKSGDEDTTIDEPSAVQKGNEIMRKLQSGGDFAAIARESSEDPQSKIQGGDIGYVSEEELKQGFSPQLASIFMSEKLQVGQIFPTPLQGKFFIFKLQERSDKDEALTLESPGKRQETTQALINARKQLLSAAFVAIAMNEAKVENFLAKRVVDNPNELSGARPASTEAPNSNSANTNATPANANTNVNAAKKEANTKVEPKKDEAKNTNAAPNTNASPAANANAKQ
jgi:peptidyl-prolyl cis-trans isomerase SurA